MLAYFATGKFSTTLDSDFILKIVKEDYNIMYERKLK